MNERQTIRFNKGEAAAHNVLQEALAQVKPNHALPRSFYKDPAIFALDLRHFVMGHWHCVGHISMIPKAHDFFTVEVGGESIIIVRGEDNEIRALLNVCRHRGSRVCTEQHGNAKGGVFVCPYHAWTYGCAGDLQRARLTPDDFDKSAYGLKTMPVRVSAGVIFITWAANPLGFKHVEDSFGRSARLYGWETAKVAARKMYQIAANWKLVTENYQECYHCGPAHQEYARRHIFARPQAQRVAPDLAMIQRDAELGIDLVDLDHYWHRNEAGQESADSFRSALVEGYQSGSRDGKGVAPLMGAFKGKDYDGGYSFTDVGPTSNFISYPDYGLIYRTIPQTVDTTGFELIWLVDGDAQEGKDYEVENLIWMWDYTSLEDKKIVEYNQAGVNSAFFEPGPYTPMEQDGARYLDWYIYTMRNI
jgi:Rieske 2Fe-2S family protein